MLIELKSITYNNDGFVIGKARVHEGEQHNHTIAIKGNLPQAAIGMWYECTAKKEIHPRYGDQWSLSGAKETMPRDKRGVLNWLADKGLPFDVALELLNQHGVEAVKDAVGDRESLLQAGMATDAVESFLETFNTFSPDKILLSVPGLGTKKVAEINAWAIHQAIDLKALLECNPYELLEAPGVGWQIADAVARQMSIAHDDPRRLSAAPYHVLTKNEGDGHTWMNTDTMLTEAAKMLSIPSHRIVDAMMQPQQYSPVVVQDNRIFKADTLRQERGVADAIRRLQESYSRLADSLEALDLDPIYEAAPFHPTNEQKAAIRHCLSNKVAILTGGPGTGKSSLTKLVVDALDHARATGIILCSPTGKAAKRLSEVTGRTARTIHSTIGKIEPDKVNVVIVDEVSMLDVQVADWLLSSLGDHTHLILIGDDQQLPSVGAGRVLYDLIKSGIPAFRLEQVHRNNGQILDVVYGIREGRVPEIDNRSDVHLFEVPDAEKIPDVVKMLVTSIIPAYGLETVKVICPQKSKDPSSGCGWNRLNRDLQAVLNPPGPGKNELRWYSETLREGDTLLWTENNSELNLVNGDEVEVEAINGWEVALSNGHSVYKDDLTATHGYACTCHKAQGSEYEAVVFVCHSSHHYMLTRRLAFTACSRAKKMLFIVGERSALDRASRNTRDEGRNTSLQEFLKADEDGA